MATSTQFHDYVMECLNAFGSFTSRKMMGEYCIYDRNKLVGEICDNMFLLKPTDAALRMLPDAERAYPYEGSKTLMIVMDRIDDSELLRQVMEAQYSALPEPKKRKK